MYIIIYSLILKVSKEKVLQAKSLQDKKKSVSQKSAHKSATSSSSSLGAGKDRCAHHVQNRFSSNHSTREKLCMFNLQHMHYSRYSILANFWKSVTFFSDPDDVQPCRRAGQSGVIIWRPKIIEMERLFESILLNECLSMSFYEFQKVS